MAITAPKPSPGGESSVLGQFSSGGTSAPGRVYFGEEKYQTYGGAKTGEGRGLPRYGSRSRWLSEEQAMNEFYGWTDKKRQDLLAQMVLAGMLPVGSGVIEAEEGWRKLVQSASRFGAADQKVSPFDLLTGYVKAAGGQNAWRQMGAFEVNTVTGEKRYAGPGVYLGGGRASQTDTRVDLTDPDTARAMATKLFQDMMGRDPGAGELGAFAKALGSAEAANPITQTTITQYDMETGQAISQDTSSAGGLSAEGKAYIGEQQIKGKKEYGVTQAVTTYQNAFEDLIYGSPG
ncbi:hypothetical protein [Streptomyces formicae]|uniref:Uncharacterized protein n=1 Tax=Streptomyces formicae TaxID=1616117 RepID=A0ABY3WIA0_9ACTN|nr:hypothetical protein [Streptomyces formicae]UNM12332.1 hypothetical protein J4032_13005 [Streptomyces formicae]